MCYTSPSGSLSFNTHYDDVIMEAIASQITSLTIVYSTVYSGVDKSKHQSSASLAFVWGIHRGPVNSPHKWSVTRKMFPFDDVIMKTQQRFEWLFLIGVIIFILVWCEAPLNISMKFVGEYDTRRKLISCQEFVNLQRGSWPKSQF